MKPLIIANWKCNPTTLKEAKQLFNSVKRGIKNIRNMEVVICPPFVWLPVLRLQDSSSVIRFGGQNCFWEEKGAFTGEVSPKMLKYLGAEYVIIGHSERRGWQNETDEMINKKIKAAISAKLKPILCFGETEKERKEGKTFWVLKNQLKNALGIQPCHSVILAYEPVWAIGTGISCLPKDAKRVLAFLRKKLKRNRILYGGSVNSQNAKDYIEKAAFNGLLVGGASLNPKEFIQIVKNVSNSPLTL